MAKYSFSLITVKNKDELLFLLLLCILALILLVLDLVFPDVIRDIVPEWVKVTAIIFLLCISALLLFAYFLYIYLLEAEVVK